MKRGRSKTELDNVSLIKVNFLVKFCSCLKIKQLLLNSYILFEHVEHL